jgi:L-threonylcarbamoyladenylate synthase
MGPSLDRAVRALGAGRLVVYPTDTLLGLAARASDARAVDRLLRAKGRSPAQPLSVAVSSIEEVGEYGRLSRPAAAFVRRHLPGPYTVLLRPTATARRRLGRPVAGGATIGIRVPDHPVARELARRAGPIVATSANRHGDPSALTLAGARRAFGAAVSVYVRAGPAPSGRASELVRLTGKFPERVARR